MKTINVASPFTLIISEAGKQPVTIDVPAGVQKVEDYIADHWYTKVHLSNGGHGTPEYAAATRAAADAAFVKAKAHVDDYQSLEEAAQDAEAAAGLDPVAPAHERLGGDAAAHEAEDEAVDLTEMSAEELVDWLRENGYEGEPVTAETDLPVLLQTAQAWQAKLGEDKAAAPPPAARSATATAAKAKAPAKPKAKKKPRGQAARLVRRPSG